jgi:hypothetical protein
VDGPNSQSTRRMLSSASVGFAGKSLATIIPLEA